MAARPRADRTARRAELVAAASRVFVERGVAHTAVSDIVKAAGVAQGTFYLYFDSKDEAVLAVVEGIVDQMVSAIHAAHEQPHAGAVERLRGLGAMFASLGDDPATLELSAFMHRPENRALHDRLAERFTPALFPFVEEIVSQGVAEGVFDVPDVKQATWFVLGGLQSAEASGAAPAEMRAALDIATALALRALGYGEVSA